MAAQTEPEIVLYDVACIKNNCFSPTVWRVRLILNYKHIPYRTSAGLIPGESASKYKYKYQYTVPTIQHIPTNTYVMNSAPIAQFLESTYSDPPVPLTSELGREIEAKARAAAGPAFRMSEYFRRTCEAELGHRLEDLLDPEKEEQAWDAVGEGMRAVGELMRTHKAEGPFVLGARPSGTDFWIAASLQSARVVDEGVFQRNVKFPGYKEVYEAYLPYLEKKD
ncbi:uncharacterized protein BDZ99DRAFT_510121 [Mytilinidion resinicola]|uniref:GST N-terminal domain-containing protein n=1 Tax=Mytilinidion resinicola TaxID=574789 RepID=A0A6A6YGW1_9PEZI|nr:uncharacterized protein BDZ99DRAFT_510121 [Mytilinidion resinicola]KAF2808056.1 hypothetical protein BDZ99DRAFT_510121 [Mytilinidion resinicola]